MWVRMMLIVRQQEELLAHHEEIDLIIRQHHDGQIQFFLLRLNFHMLQESRGEVLHQPEQAFHWQDECIPNLSLLNHSNLILFQAHKVF